jgi:hypothetical protein
MGGVRDIACRAHTERAEVPGIPLFRFEIGLHRPYVLSALRLPVRSAFRASGYFAEVVLIFGGHFSTRLRQAARRFVFLQSGPQRIIGDQRRPLVMAFTICVFAALSAAGCAEVFPTDQILLDSFKTHRVEYERLRDMVIEDKRIQLVFTANNLSSTLSEERREVYRSLLSSIGPHLMVGVDYNGIVRFVFVMHGSSAIGPSSAKGIEYVPAGARAGALVVQNLNDPEGYGEGVYLRPIKSGWFVLFQKTD